MLSKMTVICTIYHRGGAQPCTSSVCPHKRRMQWREQEENVDSYSSTLSKQSWRSRCAEHLPVRPVMEIVVSMSMSPSNRSRVCQPMTCVVHAIRWREQDYTSGCVKRRMKLATIATSKAMHNIVGPKRSSYGPRPPVRMAFARQWYV